MDGRKWQNGTSYKKLSNEKRTKKIVRDKISITDEASALEYCGYHPFLVVGNCRNIKITWPEDLIFANFYLKECSLNK